MICEKFHGQGRIHRFFFNPPQATPEHVVNLLLDLTARDSLRIKAFCT